MADMNADTTKWHYAEGKRDEMVRFIPRDTRTLLDVGCGRGGFGANLKSKFDLEVHGVELNAEAAGHARTRLDRVFELDLERDSQGLPDSRYDVVTFLDVLEHLQDPWSLLKRSHAWLRPGGTVVASLPNMRYYPVLKDLVLAKRFEYVDSGVLDRTHLRFFTLSGIDRLFRDAGFRQVRIEGINGGPLPWKLALLSRLLGDTLNDTRYVQFAVTARLGDELPLPTA